MAAAGSGARARLQRGRKLSDGVLLQAGLLPREFAQAARELHLHRAARRHRARIAAQRLPRGRSLSALPPRVRPPRFPGSLCTPAEQPASPRLGILARCGPCALRKARVGGVALVQSAPNARGHYTLSSLLDVPIWTSERGRSGARAL